MNAIPLINNIPKANTNAGSIGGPVNAMRQNPYGNETQLRQEINTSLVALKREAGTLEELINEAAQMLVTINNRIATLENDTVKKSDVVDVVQSGNMNPATSNAVSTYKTSSVTSGSDLPATSGAVYDYVFSGNVDNKITSYNNALNNGFYYVNNDTVNCPPASLGFSGYNGDGALFVQRYNDNWICQICQDFRGNGSLYVRSKNNGTWGSWSRVSSTDWERLVTLNSENYFEGKLNGNDKIIRGHFNGYLITTLTFGASIGTLPSSYKPNTRMCALIDADIGSSGRVPCIVLINTDMIIRLYPIIQNQYTGSISNVRLFGEVIFYLI